MDTLEIEAKRAAENPSEKKDGDDNAFKSMIAWIAISIVSLAILIGVIVSLGGNNSNWFATIGSFELSGNNPSALIENKLVEDSLRAGISVHAEVMPERVWVDVKQENQVKVSFGITFDNQADADKCAETLVVGTHLEKCILNELAKNMVQVSVGLSELEAKSESASTPYTVLPWLPASMVGYLAQSPCTTLLPNKEPVCEANVKTTLELTETPGVSDVGARIGFVQNNPGENFTEQCCEAGTEYDRFLIEEVSTQTHTEMLTGVDEHTALFVIDMQKDFTTGSFSQPCWGSGGNLFSQNIATLIEEMSASGALIVASKDFHPDDHCSFGGTCLNKKGSNDVRYMNYFPSHCTWQYKDGVAMPQSAPETPFCTQFDVANSPPFCLQDDYVGAEFDDTILKALSGVPAAQVEVVYKGFDINYDSFSAFPHVQTAGDDVTAEETERTGGYALPEDRARDCHGRWEETECLPSVTEFESITQPSSGPATPVLRSVPDILLAKSIDKVVVVGLVYDFCVGETAMFGSDGRSLWHATDPEITVLAELARPSFDGKPGSPFVCDTDPTGFCSDGGGTRPTFTQWKASMEANSVTVTRVVPDECPETEQQLSLGKYSALKSLRK